MSPIVRVSIFRCATEQFSEFRQLMQEADAVLRPGIEALSGLITFYVGATRRRFPSATSVFGPT